MPLPLPNLDDRRWADLVDEGRAFVPRYAGRWTDHNISDPGITLIELFASMAESATFRLNRIPARHRAKFLALIAQSPAPPRPAQTMLWLSPTAAAGSFELPAGVEFEIKNATGLVVPFRTLRHATIADVRLAAVQTDEGAGIVDRTVEWRNSLAVRVFGRDPKPGAAIHFGFEAIPPAKTITLAFRWDRPGTDAAARAVQSADERAALIAERRRWRLACRKPLPEFACSGKPFVDTDFSTPPHHSARVVWEVFTGAWTPLTPIAPETALAPGQVADDTRSLTIDGLVDLNLPAGLVKSTQGSAPASLFYVRCRLASGVYDAAPALLDIVSNAVPAEQSLAMWQQFTIPAAVTPTGTAPAAGAATAIDLTLDAAGRLLTLAFLPAAPGVPAFTVLDFQKTLGVEGRLAVEMVRAGVGTGLPDQKVALAASPIVSDETLAIYSHDGLTWQRWQIRRDFDASARVDWHCTIEATSGVVSFGNGERGRVVPNGHTILVTGRATAALAVSTVRSHAPATLSRSLQNGWRLALLSPADRAKVSASTGLAWPAYGAADAETLAHASGRAAEVLHAHARLVDLAEEARVQTLDQIERARVRSLGAPTKAVNALDLERIALDAPGTRLARARAWPDTFVGQPCLSAPGFVTLVIVPDLTTDAPQPSPGLCRAVKRYIDRRRMVTTMVSVVGPTYLVVSVRAVIRLQRGADAARTRALIVEALNRFLDPRTGGPDGLGWPFGRDVYRAEILQIIDGVPGVDHLLDLSLTASGGSPQCGNLRLCPTWLAASGLHHLSFE